MEVRIIHNITKEYPDMFRITSFKNPRIYVGEGRVKRHESLVGKDYVPSITSLARTRTLIRDLVLCNDFELFCTFTFDPDKIDRFSYAACRCAIGRWLHHQKEKSPDLMYLIVPEQHKNGAWHFHALISHYKGSLRDSKHKTDTGRVVYNMTSYRGGFSTATPIDSQEQVANYVMKYITKDFIRTFNKKRFVCSQNLRRPIKEVNSPVLSLTPPLFKHKTFENEDYECYCVDSMC